MLITSLADPNLESLLVTHEDMESAVFLSKIFTHAMVKKMQGELREKIAAKFGDTLKASLQSQVSQIKATEVHNSAKARDGWFRKNCLIFRDECISNHYHTKLHFDL